MSLDLFIRYGSLWTLLLGLLSLLFAVRSYRRQVNAQILFEIAGRYHDIIQSFPAHEWAARLAPPDEAQESSAEVTSGVLRYMATVHFAFILHDLHYLSKDLWKILQTEHRRTLRTHLFKREWRRIRAEFDFFPAFLAYVDSVQSDCGLMRKKTAKHAIPSRDGSSDSEFRG
jgi:hypothetical protein